ncbi:DUF6308 family protein [Rhodococcus pyridinivorans]|uniref:DUF6308 family protein n=1 Tax=Rhodococcus pyridinivorans TaxID=103816 RepID=UPI002227198B|nr:DUF6308 family protein [Rhodococcus pyridinivorans]MCW3472271.1 DUF6308 family protein [Rhodococcus pyridinivorans]
MNRAGGEAAATALVIAGRSIDIDTAVAKAHGYPAVTVTRYDLPGPGPAAVITADEIARTHKVRSRISHAQRDWFIRTAVDAPWEAVPTAAQLIDADPNLGGELYDRAEALYDHFRTAAPRHVGVAKISKVLHLKRPGLFPILDSKVMAFYRHHARAAAADTPTAPSVRCSGRPSATTCAPTSTAVPSRCSADAWCSPRASRYAGSRP